ncbi:thermosome subunit beta [Candidatus Methanocrinis natronophilus]|uniref:Thermosome subunit beta n=1 Tax=Candidatus Methanocrinis natronophilus TaxID=3033396 RepID=A0ABT5X987_9EURY|nr:thermosome subunit beta [Candidatus Methanocrinis natronophilus]MDF0591270.1 thermosome subunit beta [Candidatus Methanocrinis natronophilus]
MASLGGQPILILREGARRERGREAMANNIMAARAVAKAVRSTLGPRGMDKLLVDTLGDVTITNDGVTILREMEVEHPAAKMLVEAAKAQNEIVGDGTTSVAILTGELLKRAEDLMDLGIHPTMIVSGYSMAQEKAIEVLEEMAREVSEKDRDLLEKIAITSMTGKLAGDANIEIAKHAVDMVLAVTEVTDEGKKVVSLKNVIVEKKAGESMEDSQFIQGVIIDKERVHSNMPKKVEKARIAILGTPIEARDTETKAEITITSSDQFKIFADQEKEAIKKVVDKVIATGANVVFCQKGIDDLAQSYLAKAGITAFRRIRKTDLKKLARATGGNMVTNLDEMTEKDLGRADLVEEKKVGGAHMTFVTGLPQEGTVSLLLRGGTQQVVDSLERALDDALHAVAAAVEDGTLVAGGGAPEVELYLKLREYSANFKGREQLAVAKFAEAMAEIPKALAENAGFDPITKLTDMKSSHEAGMKTGGLNTLDGKVVDMWSMGVVEPLRVKTQAIKSATEAANLILRIDDVIASKRTEQPPAGAGMGGMPGGMCGMPAGMGGMGGMGMPPGMM